MPKISWEGAVISPNTAANFQSRSLSVSLRTWPRRTNSHVPPSSSVECSTYVDASINVTGTKADRSFAMSRLLFANQRFQSAQLFRRDIAAVEQVADQFRQVAAEQARR